MCIHDSVTIGHVQSAKDEQELISLARSALSSCNWTIGECASEWVKLYARGRTDADFGTAVGLSADQIFQRRRCYEKFGATFSNFESLSWSHFYAALNWEDAPECLRWADDVHATVSEMKAWRRAQRGEDLTTAADPQTEGGNIPDESEDAEAAPPRDDVTVAPSRKRGKKKKRATGSKSSSPEPAPEPETPASQKLNVNDAVLSLRNLMRSVEKEIDPEDIAEVYEELLSWARKLSPPIDASGKFKPPRTEAELSLFRDAVKAYCDDRQNGIDPDSFVDYHQSQGWKKSNGKPLVDWKAAVRTWERKQPRQLSQGGSKVERKNQDTAERMEQGRRFRERGTQQQHEPPVANIPDSEVPF